MRLSNTITTITGGGSDGWDLFIKARKMISEGHDITELTIGEHDIKTDTRILEAMHTAALGGATGYAMVPGIDDLRNAVATRLAARTGVPTTLDNVLITAGGQAALFAAFRAALDEGDTALYINPYYATYPGTIRSVGGVPKAVTAEADNGFLPTFEALDAAATGAKALLINSPNNPTGALIERPMLEDIASIADSVGAYLLCDEVYRGTAQQGDGMVPSIVDLYHKGISTAGMSKVFSLAGLRVGWVVAPKELTENILIHRDYDTISVGMINDHFAALALESADQLLARSQRITRENLAVLDTWIQNEPRVSWVKPRAGTTAMLKLDIPVSSREFCIDLVQKTGVMLTPGDAFDMEGYARIGFANELETIKVGLQALSAYLQTTF